MWWRLTKTIIVSWLVGVGCGALMVVLVQEANRTPPATSAASDAPRTSGVAPAVPSGEAH
jgi:hypothetical protein